LGYFMRVVGAILFAIWASGLACQPALAEKRIALAIGNSNYQNVSHLANPANDAATLAATFRKANFDIVTLRVDLSAIEMRRALRDFGEKARDADIAVVYYAGHGIEVDGINYLIPVDAALERDTDIYDEALSLERVLIAVEPARALRLIILDACRDNPFAKHMKQKIARRSVGRGLAKVEPPSPDTMIAFAAKAGFTASDGDDRKTSPFAAALAEHLTKPGLDLRKAFGFVRDDVLKATDNRQEPFIYGSLGGDDVALVPAPAVAPPANPAPYPNEAIRHDYELAERVGSREVWDSFLSTHPDGFYAKLAQAQHNKLAAEEGRVAATEKARLAAEERARLAAEGAKAAEQAKAAVTAKAAEEARVTAEKRRLRKKRVWRRPSARRPRLRRKRPRKPGSPARKQGSSSKKRPIRSALLPRRRRLRKRQGPPKTPVLPPTTRRPLARTRPKSNGRSARLPPSRRRSRPARRIRKRSDPPPKTYHACFKPNCIGSVATMAPSTGTGMSRPGSRLACSTNTRAPRSTSRSQASTHSTSFAARPRGYAR
jgi:hypothetical protein